MADPGEAVASASLSASSAPSSPASPPIKWPSFSIWNGKCSVARLAQFHQQKSYPDDVTKASNENEYLAEVFYELRHCGDITTFGIDIKHQADVEALLDEFLVFSAPQRPGQGHLYAIKGLKSPPIQTDTKGQDGDPTEYRSYEWASALAYLLLLAPPPTQNTLAEDADEYYHYLLIMFADILRRSFAWTTAFKPASKTKRIYVSKAVLVICAKVPQFSKPNGHEPCVHAILGGTVERIQKESATDPDTHVRNQIRQARRDAMFKSSMGLPAPLVGNKSLQNCVATLCEDLRQILLENRIRRVTGRFPQGLMRAELDKVCDRLEKSLPSLIRDDLDEDRTGFSDVIVRLIEYQPDIKVSLPKRLFDFLIALIKLTSITPDDQSEQLSAAATNPLDLTSDEEDFLRAGLQDVLDEEISDNKAFASLKDALKKDDLKILDKIEDIIAKKQKTLADQSTRFKNLGNCAEANPYAHFGANKDPKNARLQGLAISVVSLTYDDNKVLWSGDDVAFEQLKGVYELPCNDCKVSVLTLRWDYPGDEDFGYNALIRKYISVTESGLWTPNEMRALQLRGINCDLNAFKKT